MYIVCIGILLSIVSCGNKNNIAKILKKMEAKPIDLCLNQLPCYINGDDTLGYKPTNYKHLMIVHIDSSNCTSCRISNLHQWKEWINLAQDSINKFSIVFIFQPTNKELERTNWKLAFYSKKRYPQTPLYLDKMDSFFKNNFEFDIPETMQTFIVDNNDSIVYVGNPLKSADIDMQIKHIINH